MTSAVRDRVIELYKTLAQIPTLSGAKLLKNGAIINSVWTQRNLERTKTTKICRTQSISENFETILNLPFSTDITHETISSVSPQETYRAVIVKDATDSKKQFLEIWKANYMERCIDLSALDIHGDVYADSELGSLKWNKEETELIYVAERKLTKSEPFVKRKSVKTKTNNEKENEETTTKGEEYVYKQEWGEQLVGKHLSVIVKFNLSLEQFTLMEGLPDHWCPGQVLWTPDSQSIVGVAWETEPRRLGLIFCTNRPSYVFSLHMDGTYDTLSLEGMAVRSPRFSLDDKNLLWLQRSAGGPHHACLQVVKKSWPFTENNGIDVLLDIIRTSIDLPTGGTYTGFYAQSLPSRCFANDGNRLIFSTAQAVKVNSYVLNIDSGTMIDISEEQYSLTIIDVHNDVILASRNSMKTPSQLLIGKLPSAGEERNIAWVKVSEDHEALPSELSDATVKYLTFTHSNDDSVNKFTSLYLGKDESRPVLLWPHGGPHSSFTDGYSTEATLYYMLGFDILQVNFRGSVGDGQDTVEYLPGKVGDADVKDCVFALQQLPEEVSIDQTKCSLIGGSHGGFLVLHLIGQYPDMFKGVVSRNPVTDIASMMNATDIPDWCAYEAGSVFNEVGPVSDDLLLTMRKASPLSHAHNAKTPTLFCLGTNDLRVPFFQGINFYHKLRANGCKTKALIYEDNHSLSSSAAEIDQIINGAIWTLEHIDE